MLFESLALGASCPWACVAQQKHRFASLAKDSRPWAEAIKPSVKS